MEIRQQQHIPDSGFYYRQEGEKASDHAVLVFGFDNTIECPDGSTGAFKVVWHADLRGFTSGWMPYTFTDQFFNRNWTYGFEI